jgi:2-aminoadipate transaminase
LLNTFGKAENRIALANWARKKSNNPIVELLSLAAQPGLVSFALGLPAPELFPIELYKQAVDFVLTTDEWALQYGAPYQPLKKHIVSLMARRGVECHEDQVFLTTGAQQGMALVTRLLLDHCGQVICEETVYSGFQQVIEPLQPSIITVSTNLETGLDVEAVESVLASGRRAAFIYTIPDGHNPLGVDLSPDKRAYLVALARRYGVPIIEDDAYGFLHYDDSQALPMRALDDQWVFHIGTFSKILAPGLRVGWIIVPRHLISRMSVAKESIDIDTCTFTQRTIAAFMEIGNLSEHISMLRQEYRTRRNAMASALNEYFPAETQWTFPDSGFFVWVELPLATDVGGLLRTVIEKEQVVFIPGESFSVNPASPASHGLRLSFSNCSLNLIEEGVKRIARTLKTFL